MRGGKQDFQSFEFKQKCQFHQEDENAFHATTEENNEFSFSATRLRGLFLAIFSDEFGDVFDNENE